MTTHLPAPSRLTWQSFVLWIGLTIAGYILGSDLHYQGGIYAPFNASDIDLGASIVGFVFGAVSGLIISSLQWIVLRRWAPNIRLWIPLNIVGFGLVHALNDSVPYLVMPMPMLLLVGGFIVGLAQFIALRQTLSMAGLWILIPVGTWVLGFQLGFAVVALVFGNPLLELILGGGTIGLVTSLITGITFTHMLPNRASHEHSGNIKNSRWSRMSRSRKILLASVVVGGVVVMVFFATMMLGMV